MVRAHLFVILFAILALRANACIPHTLLVTRATGLPAIKLRNGPTPFNYFLGNVNVANIWGSLKFVISEAIDLKTGVARTSESCQRKNNVTFIQFYNLIFCNPTSVVNQLNIHSKEEINANESNFTAMGYGPFLAFDGGKCNGDPLCGKLSDIGPWIGAQFQEDDQRNPTEKAIWLSIPGECPLKPWDEKTKECKDRFPSKRCPMNGAPDGIQCVWNAQYLGEINLDDLVGITTMINRETHRFFTNYNEFCLQGGVEFDKNGNQYRSLDFWSNPLDKGANHNRIVKLVQHYSDKRKYPQNHPLPAIDGLIMHNVAPAPLPFEVKPTTTPLSLALSPSLAIREANSTSNSTPIALTLAPSNSTIQRSNAYRQKFSYLYLNAFWIIVFLLLR